MSDSINLNLKVETVLTIEDICKLITTSNYEETSIFITNLIEKCDDVFADFKFINILINNLIEKQLSFKPTDIDLKDLNIEALKNIINLAENKT